MKKPGFLLTDSGMKKGRKEMMIKVSQRIFRHISVSFAEISFTD